VKLPYKRKAPTLAKFLPQRRIRIFYEIRISVLEDFLCGPLCMLRGTSFLDTSNFYPMPIPISPIPLAIAEF
jgi:hypothetical protein